MTPPGWTTVTLRDVASDISYGFTASASDVANGPKMLRITDIQDNRVDWNSVPRCECDATDKYLLHPGDIVIARTGATTGKSFLLGDVPEASVFASYLIRVQPSAVVVPAYLASYMQSPSYWAQITTVSKGTAQPGANASILGGLELPLAPVEEQRRIVAKLEALQSRSRRAREALDAVPPLLEKLRQSILAAAFRGDLTADWRAQNPNTEPASALLARIRTERRKKWEEAELAKLKAKGKTPTDDRWKAKYKEPQPIDAAALPALPERWSWASLEELVVDGPTNGFSPKSESTGSGTPTLKLSATSRGICILDERTTKRTVEAIAENEPFWLSPGDLLIQRANTLDYVGTTAVFNGPDKTYIYPDLMMRVRANILTGPYFLWRALTTTTARSHMRSRATGTAGNMPKVNGDVVRSIPIPLPPLGEQAVILALLDRHGACVAIAEEQARLSLSQLQALDSSALAKAFRGELVPPNPTDEPAAVALSRFGGEASTESPRPRAARTKATG